MAKAAKPRGGTRLNKRQFAARHAERHAIGRPTVGGEHVIDAPAAQDEVIRVFDSVLRETVAGNDVFVTGFGTFAVYDLPPRNARNPQTGERVRVPKTRVVRFHTGQAYRDYLNRKLTLPKKGSAVAKKPKGSGSKAALTRAATKRVVSAK